MNKTIESKQAREIPKEIMLKLEQDQQHEITAYHLYTKLASVMKDPHNKGIVQAVANDELKHYNELKKVTQKNFEAQKLKIFWFYWIIRIFGMTFGIKLMEKGEETAKSEYKVVEEYYHQIEAIMKDEERHETELINMLNEEKLNYIGSVVLGLNDALVELTGALAGYTFAFQNTRLIALTGLITGISASLSMAASEYLSTRQEGGDDALKSSLYTGAAYVFTVVMLIVPFLVFTNPFLSLALTLCVAVLIIFVFNYYIAIAKDYNFKKRFLEMAVISLGVAGISFAIGILIKLFIGIDI